MVSEKYSITLNSVILYVIAFLITTMIHEFAHALVGLFHQSDPVLHHNYVEHLSTDHLTIGQSVLIALAGPVVSLIQGIGSAWVYSRSKQHSLPGLFLVWFSVLGFNNFLGYLMTGPLFQAGDIGKSYHLLNVPLSIQIIIAVLAALLLLYIANRMTTPFLEFCYRRQWVKDGHARKAFSFRIIIIPWIIGSAIITVLYLPIVAIISIIYPIMSGFVFIYPWQNAQRIKNVTLSESKKAGSLSVISISILILLILVFRLALAPGLAL